MEMRFSQEEVNLLDNYLDDCMEQKGSYVKDYVWLLNLQDKVKKLSNIHKQLEELEDWRNGARY
jgi:hypothetical protein